MARKSCWRLVGVRSLVLVVSIFIASIIVVSIFVAPTFLRGQDAAADRSPGLAPDPVLNLIPNLPPQRHSPIIAPVWISPPRLPQPYPVGRDPHAHGTNIFPQLVRAAGIIFSGRVTSIGRAPSSFGQAPASTTVTFKVEHGMRGASAGQSLTIHEWAGLWTSGERYRVGERVLLFLYAPSRLGLTSLVAGTIGRFAMDAEGRIIMSPQHVTLATNSILSGKTVVPYADFIQAVRSREE